MPTIKSRLVNLAMILLPLAALGVVGLCVRSFWLDDSVGLRQISASRPAVERYILLHSFEGRFWIQIGATRDAAGSENLALKRYKSPGIAPLHYLGDDRTDDEFGMDGPTDWKSGFDVLGFGISRYGRSSYWWVANGLTATTQPMAASTAIGYTFSFPQPLVIVALLAWPISRKLRSWRTNRRLRAGLCTRCGYDIRATPTQCPECGHQAAKPGRSI